MTWRAFLDRLGGLSLESRWMRALAADQRTDSPTTSSSRSEPRRVLSDPAEIERYAAGIG